MRAGTVVPATVTDNGSRGRLSGISHRRSMRAGTVVPATVVPLVQFLTRKVNSSIPLNEGRDRSPGDRPAPPS